MPTGVYPRRKPRPPVPAPRASTTEPDPDAPEAVRDACRRLAALARGLAAGAPAGSVRDRVGRLVLLVVTAGLMELAGDKGEPLAGLAAVADDWLGRGG